MFCHIYFLNKCSIPTTTLVKGSTSLGSTATDSISPFPFQFWAFWIRFHSEKRVIYFKDRHMCTFSRYKSFKYAHSSWDKFAFKVHIPTLRISLSPSYSCYCPAPPWDNTTVSKLEPPHSSSQFYHISLRGVLQYTQPRNNSHYNFSWLSPLYNNSYNNLWLYMCVTN